MCSWSDSQQNPKLSQDPRAPVSLHLLKAIKTQPEREKALNSYAFHLWPRSFLIHRKCRAEKKQLETQDSSDSLKHTINVGERLPGQ